MTLPQKTATVFGGTGFIGRYIVRDLARAGYWVKVATRVPEKTYTLRPYGVVGQVVPVLCDVHSDESVAAAIRGSDVVVNCIGILYERHRGEFMNIHSDLPERIAKECAAFGTPRIVHISALSSDRAGSCYARTKLAGEKRVLELCPAATILRPSVVFGPEDNFFNLFAGMARFLPVLPLIGGGKTKFQPVYVGDVAAAVVAVLGRPETQGGIYELGGPEVMTFRQIYEAIFKWTGRRRLLVPVPFGVMGLKAMFLQFVPPRPLLTPDQVVSLKTDNVVGDYALGFAQLGIMPTGTELIVPGYLERFRDGGRFADKKTA